MTSTPKPLDEIRAEALPGAEAVFDNEFGNRIEMRVTAKIVRDWREQEVNVRARSPHSIADHTWTAKEAEVLSGLLRLVIRKLNPPVSSEQSIAAATLENGDLIRALASAWLTDVQLAAIKGAIFLADNWVLTDQHEDHPEILEGLSEKLADPVSGVLTPLGSELRAMLAFAEQSATTEIAAEAFDDAIATLAVIRATATDPEEWNSSGDHFREICRTAIIKLQALKRAFAEQSGAGELAEAIKPFADFHGDLPDYYDPLRCVYESGIQYAVELLAKTLDVADYEVCDGTDEFDGDLGGTMFNIVLAAMPENEHGDRMHPSEVRAALAAPRATAVEREALKNLLDALTAEFGWRPDAPSDERVIDDPDCCLTWGVILAANDALQQGEGK